MFDFFKTAPSQGTLNEKIVNNILIVSKNVADLVLIIHELTTAYKLLHSRLETVEKYVLSLHERLKALEPGELKGNGFPSFKI